MRLALVILIAVVQVAGPWLCCCGPVRLRLMRADPVERVGVRQVAAIPVQAECPHCKKSEPPAAPTPGPADPKPHPTQDSCPCGGVELLAITAERQVETDVGFTFAVELLGFAILSSPVISLSVASVPGLRELPNMTVYDRLYKHHVLRC